MDAFRSCFGSRVSEDAAKMKPVLSRRGNELLKNAEGGIFDLFKKILGNMCTYLMLLPKEQKAQIG